MEPAHRGLPPRPLPGEREPANASTTISQIDVDDGADEMDPRMQNEGFFESLFGGAKPRNAEKLRKDRLTATERRQRAQEEH